MGAPAIGSIVVREGKRGPVYGLRFRAYGKRRFVTLGREADGWSEQKAHQRLNEVLDEVAIGSWTPPDAPLNDVIREILDSSATGDPSELAEAVIKRASDDALRAELEALISTRIRTLMHTGRETDPLNARWHVPEQGYKRLRDFRAADCDTVADDYERRAAELQSHAEVMRRLGAEVRRRRVSLVGDLPADSVRAMITVKRDPEAVDLARKRAASRKPKLAA